jgi:hypothetical protein
LLAENKSCTAECVLSKIAQQNWMPKAGSVMAKFQKIEMGVSLYGFCELPFAHVTVEREKNPRFSLQYTKSVIYKSE